MIGGLCDAHLCYANGGSRRLVLRLPATLQSLDAAAAGRISITPTTTFTRLHVIARLSRLALPGIEHDGRKVLA